MSPTNPEFIFTCEHGGNNVPTDYRRLFKNEQELLNTHRGYDPGALSLARRLAKHFHSPLFYSEITRLLIELNRSRDHRHLFSKFSKQLAFEEQQQLIETLYRPYREQVIAAIQEKITDSPVIHVSIHSFTPVMNEKVRRTDIGLLFDPTRSLELEFCREWKARLKHQLPDLAIHFNLPYRGTSDGFTTALRKQFSNNHYAGIELEVNQKFVQDKSAWTELQKRIVASIQARRARE